MKLARFTFDPSLQTLLKRDLRGEPVEMDFKGPQSAKHLIESLGIPHTEIGSLRVNGQVQSWDYITQNGDRIEVQEVLEKNLETEPCFVLDGHLGKLTSHLRMLGLDCLYDNTLDDEELVVISMEQGRNLLTRDRLLLMHKVITLGYLLRSLNPKEQLREVVKRFDLEKWIRPFARCMRCNHLLEDVEKETVLERLEALTKKYYHEFKICPACEQVYWKGSHYKHMLDVINKISSH